MSMLKIQVVSSSSLMAKAQCSNVDPWDVND